MQCGNVLSVLYQYEREHHISREYAAHTKWVRFKAGGRTGISPGFSRSPYNTYGGPDGTARAILTSYPGPGNWLSRSEVSELDARPRFLH